MKTTQEPNGDHEACDRSPDDRGGYDLHAPIVALRFGRFKH